ncbi:MAG: methyltransferase domain-containing protein [Nitrolancea sp.]
MSMWARGESYEPYVGRWSRLVARDFVQWLEMPPGKTWLDVGCGTGALCAAIVEFGGPEAVTGVDASEDYAAYARERTPDERVEFQIGNALELPFPGASFDVTVSGLVLNFVKDSQQALSEMVRVTKPGGVVALYVWDYAGEMQSMRYFWDAAAELDPAARERDQGIVFPICQPEPLERAFADNGLMNVTVRAIDIPTVFRDFDDYWNPFLGGQGGAPTYVKTMPEEQRNALRDALRAKLPTRDDGSIPLIARAWAIRGQRPSTR